jgi:NitT/TauT family transport system substrate-binding protein
MRSSSRRSFLAASLSSAAAFSTIRFARAQDRETVTVGTVESVSDTPFYIAQERGYYTDAKLDVVFQPFDSGATMIASLGNGQLDAGGGAPSAGLYNGIARGFPIKIVADRGIAAPGYGFVPLVVRKELVASGKYKTLADLKGLRVAEPAKGSTMAPALVHALAKGGLGYDDVQHVIVPFPDQAIAFKNGSIDAAVMLEPFATEAIRQGVVTRVAGDDTFYPNQQITVLLYGPSLTGKRVDVANRFMVAYLRALRDYHGALHDGHLRGPGSDAIVAIMEKHFHVSDPSVFREMTPNSCDPSGRPNVVSLRDDAQTFRKLGFSNTAVDMATVVDLRFVDAAAKTLGPARGH